MKRLIAGGLLLLLVAIAIFLWLQNRDSLSASQIAPVECLAYVELPNIIQTSEALARLRSLPNPGRTVCSTIPAAADFQGPGRTTGMPGTRLLPCGAVRFSLE